MPTINIACSGGIESAYMIQKAMEMGASVNVCWINLSGNRFSNLGELRSLQQTIAYFQDSGRDKNRYPGNINNVYYRPECPYQPMGSRVNSVINTTVTQQYALVLGMMDMLTGTMSGDDYPTTWLGWLREDSSEFSHNEYDHSEAAYKELLNLNTVLGRLSNSNTIAKPFRAPLWEMRKHQIWLKLDPELATHVVPNGRGSNIDDHVWGHVPFDLKVKEYKKAGIPIKDSYNTPDNYESDVDLWCRALCGMASWLDLNLPSTAQGVILGTYPFDKDTRVISHSNIGSFRMRLREKIIVRILAAQKVELNLDEENQSMSAEKSFEA